jgi:drug/metabolite transporter (DMT)-like permease
MWAKAQVHIALFIVNLIYAANYTIAKGVMPGFVQPLGFVLLRVAGALLLYLAFTGIFIKGTLKKEDVPRMALCGFFGVALNQMLFFKGLSITTAINASLIMITAPILVLIMSAIILKERMGPWKILGIALGFTGAFLVVRGPGFGIRGDTWIGDLFVFINATAYAIYLVIVKPLMKRYHPLFVIRWVFTFGLIPVLFFGWQDVWAINWSDLTQNYLIAILYVIIGTTFMAYLLNIFALSRANPTLVGIYIYLQPILASIIAVYFADERITGVKLLAAALIFLGVYLVSLKPKPQTARV